MTPINLQSAFRHLWKNKLFSRVNTIGLSVGLASVMALLIGVYVYMTSNSMLQDKDRICYLKSTDANRSRFKRTTYPLLDEKIKTHPEVEAVTHIQSWSNPWLSYGEKEAQENTAYIDTGIFRAFTLPLKCANTTTALRDKFYVVSEKVAGQLYDRENPVGKIISADDTIQLPVTGIIENIFANSAVRSEIFLTRALLKSYPGFLDNANWHNGFAYNFLKLRPAREVAAFDPKFVKFSFPNYEPDRKTAKVNANSFSNISNDASTIVNVIIKSSPGTALFILLIILVNLLNLNTACIYGRSKDVAVKQMIGSSKMNIVKQFCVENGIIVLLSVVITCFLLMHMLLQELNNMDGSQFGELSLSLHKDYLFGWLFVVIGILLTIAAGWFPALKLISIRVSDAVKGKIASTGSNHRVRNSCIAFRFTLAIIFICVTIILNRQIDFIKSPSTGFNQDNVVVVTLVLVKKNKEAAAVHFESVLNKLKAEQASIF